MSVPSDGSTSPRTCNSSRTGRGCATTDELLRRLHLLCHEPLGNAGLLGALAAVDDLALRDNLTARALFEVLQDRGDGTGDVTQQDIDARSELL